MAFRNISQFAKFSRSRSILQRGVVLRSEWITTRGRFMSTNVRDLLEEEVQEEVIEEVVEEYIHPMMLRRNFFITPTYHEGTFQPPLTAKSSLHEVMEGGYIELDTESIKEFFPEGLSDEIPKEFDFTGKNMMMIRDITKALCRILDEVNPRDNEDHTISSVESRNLIDGLTDRNEQSLAIPSIKYYGVELFKPKGWNRKKHRTEDVMRNTKGPGSFQCNILDHIKNPLNYAEFANNQQSQEAKKFFEKVSMPSSIMLAGKKGSGKSFVLNQMVLHARKNGWLVLFIPDGWDHSMSGLYCAPAFGQDELQDNPFMTVKALRGFWRANKDKLENLDIRDKSCLEKYQPILEEFKAKWEKASAVPGRDKLHFIEKRFIIYSDSYIDGVEEKYQGEDQQDRDVLADFDIPSFDSPTTLKDLVELGVAFRDVSGSIFIDLVKELREVEKYPVMIAVDQYNAWHSTVKTPFQVHVEGQYAPRQVYADELCVPHALSLLTENKEFNEANKLKNGVFVAAISQRHPQGLKINYYETAPSIPLRVEIPHFNQIEYLSAISHYLSLDHVRGRWALGDLLTYRMFCGSNPLHCRTGFVEYFFPMAILRESPNVDFYNPSAALSVNEDGSLAPLSDDMDEDFGGYNEDSLYNTKDDSDEDMSDDDEE